MKVVLDTNILASGAISAAGTLSTIVDAWRSGQFRVIVSTPIVDELERSLQKPYFRRDLTEKQASRFLKLLQRRATVSPITVPVHNIAAHQEDDVILATAVSAQADYLVTGDGKLQRLGMYRSGFLGSLPGLERVVQRGSGHLTCQEGDHAAAADLVV